MLMNKEYSKGQLICSIPLVTLGEGLGGLPSPTQGFQKASTGGADYSDASIQARYSGCDTMKPAIDSGEINYNLLSTNMKGLVDSCP